MVKLIGFGGALALLAALLWRAAKADGRFPAGVAPVGVCSGTQS